LGGIDKQTPHAVRRVAWLALGLLLLVTVVFLIRADRSPEPLLADPLPADLRALADAGPLRVGWSRDVAPISIWDGDTVTGGYAVELWNLMAIKVGLDLEHVAFDDTASVVQALRDGSIDIAGAHGARPDLAEFATATDPLTWERITFVGAPEQSRLGTETLAGRAVSTVPGSPLVIALGARFPEADYVATETIHAGLAATARGEIDLYLTTLGLAGYTMREDNLDLVPIGEDVEVVTLSGWAHTDGRALALATAGRDALTDEEISLITVRWTGFDLGPPRDSTPSWLSQAFAVAVALAVGFGLFTLIMRRRVRAATTELTHLNRQLATMNVDLERRVDERTSELASAVEGLNRSNLALTEFAQSVAHDLRGPVTAIYGMSSLLGAIDVGQEQQEKMLSSIESSSSRLSGMIESLLDGAVRAGAQDPGLDGHEFAGWLREILGPEVDVIGAALEVDVPPGRIPLDTAVLRRAAINLVGNALKYATNTAGTRVAVRLVPTADDTWVLTVDDNGPGIPASLRTRVFDTGYRGSEDERGRGLGLGGTREAVERAGGSIGVDISNLGGARFTVVLPVRDATASPGLDARGSDMEGPAVTGH
jgi:signal transduction histidine kinase